MKQTTPIAIYSQVIADPSLRWQFNPFQHTEQLFDNDTFNHDVKGKLEPVETKRFVMHIAAVDERMLKYRYPALYPHMTVKPHPDKGVNSGTVLGTSHVYLDPLIADVVMSNIRIVEARTATEMSNLKYANTHKTKIIAKASAKLDSYRDRINNLNNMSLGAKLLHVVISWFNGENVI